MGSRVRKRAESEQGEDRLSKLPGSLLHRIFSSIDTVDAVKTCVLSKAWRYFWCSLPSLSFDADYMPLLNNHEAENLATVLFVNFISQVVERRDAIPIIKFRYRAIRCSVEASVVQSWIHYAIEHKVQHLDIRLSLVHCDTIRFPPCFYGCESITTLELNGCYGSIELPGSFNLPFLKSFYLMCFDNVDGSIFSTCPNLETLKLEDVNNRGFPGPIFSICALKLKSLEVIQIYGLYAAKFGTECSFKVKMMTPKLMKFKYAGGFPFNCCTENLVSLEQVEITVCTPQSSSYPCCLFRDGGDQRHALYLFDMLYKFHNAKSIKLCLDAMKHLCLIPSSMNKRRSPFSNLKYLKVMNRWMENVRIPEYILTYFLKRGGVFEVV